jgi:hypothetical protein
MEMKQSVNQALSLPLRFLILISIFLSLSLIAHTTSTQRNISLSTKTLSDDEGSGEESPSYIHYLPIYESLSPETKPFGLALMVLWLAFLFSSVGTTGKLNTKGIGREF